MTSPFIQENVDGKTEKDREGTYFIFRSCQIYL